MKKEKNKYIVLSFSWVRLTAVIAKGLVIIVIDMLCYVIFNGAKIIKINPGIVMTISSSNIILTPIVFYFLYG